MVTEEVFLWLKGTDSREPAPGRARQDAVHSHRGRPFRVGAEYEAAPQSGRSGRVLLSGVGPGATPHGSGMHRWNLLAYPALLHTAVGSEEAEPRGTAGPVYLWSHDSQIGPARAGRG